MSAPVSASQHNPVERIFQVAFSLLGSIALNVAAELRIADLLADGPRPVSDLARETATNEDALYRVLRLLASLGIFSESAPRTFANSPASDTLRDAAPNSTGPMARFLADPFHFRVAGDLMHSVRTGQPAVEHVTGLPVFEYFATDKHEAEVFNSAMVSISAQVIPEVLATYDFAGIQVLVDVAGGHGSVICPILQEYPQIRGILTDLPHVLEGAAECICNHGVEARIQRIPCDFFKSVPESGNAYLMKNIIHDWNDEKCLTILGNIRKAMGATKGKVILIEAVLSPGNEPHMGKFLDLEMLIFPGGHERTEQEFRSLFDRAGFRLTRIVPNNSPLWVIEAERV